MWGIIDNSRTSPPEQVAFNLLFLNMYDGGQAYTEQEHRDWLEQAGFVDAACIHGPQHLFRVVECEQFFEGSHVAVKIYYHGRVNHVVLPVPAGVRGCQRR